MQERVTRIAILISALFLLGSLPLMNSVSAEDEVDNWPSGDAWLHIELISWSANETVEWDNNNGLPDPHFEICIEADGVNIDCIDTPTWDDQMELVNPWNYSIDIPDYSNILNITIECRDNDAINDDECDMNSELDEWKLYAQYNWSLTPTKGVIGNGDGDENGTWKNAASEWRFTVDSDSDNDGIMDASDDCPNTSVGESVDSSGCSDSQRDSDSDGYFDASDPFPNDSSQWADRDGDGYGDNMAGHNGDKYPDEPTQWADSDMDGYGDNPAGVTPDSCPQQNGFSTADRYGCLDSDQDGYSNPTSDWTISNGADAFPAEISQWADTDFDGYGDNLSGITPDACTTVVGHSTLDRYGCIDSDGDGYSDDGLSWTVSQGADACPSTGLGETVDAFGCSAEQRDSDSDGIVDSRDECPNTATGASVYSTGCLRVEEDSRSDSNSESSSGATSSAGDTFVGFTICCLLPIGGIVYFTNNRKKKTPQHRVRTPPSRQQHIPIQRQPSQQEIQAQQLAHQKQIETQHFQQKLAQQIYQTQQLEKQLAQQTHSETQMNTMQAELAQLQESKAALEKELEDSSKSTTVVQNITYNIQDSAISGDLTANLKPKDE